MALPIAQELKERIEFMTVSAPFSAVGKLGESTAVFARAWARIIQMGGGELSIDTQQTQSSAANYEVWTRYIDGINGGMQIAWGARTLVITEPPQKVIDGNNRRWWLIQAQETVGI